METGDRVAVVGGGVAGLTTAYLLRRRYEVTLYDADDRLGGHAHTHELADRDGLVQQLDTGFLVHNRRTYPHLIRLFAELGVATQESEMSMSVRCEGCGLEYAGARGPAGLLAQPRALADPRYLRLLAEVPLFHRAARRLLADPYGDTLTVGAFLAGGRPGRADARPFSAYFRSHFMTPVISAVWSCPAATALEYPAQYLFRFLANHGMLSVTGSPAWRTVTGGSREYVRRIGKQVPSVRVGSAVRQVVRDAEGVTVATADGGSDRHRAVVLALHADDALAVLGSGATPAEREVLGAFRYSHNETLLHQDASVLPHAPRARASWNYLMPDCGADAGAVRVSYDLNRLQRLRTRDRYLVTLNGEPGTNPGTNADTNPDAARPAGPRIDPASVLARMVYRHPVYTHASVAAQRRLPELNDGRLRTAFAGAYHGWGFHEDGCRSGVEAAESLGVHW